MPGAKAASVFVDQVQPGRTAGELFASGKTMLVHTSGGTRILNSHDGDGFGVALHVAFFHVISALSGKSGKYSLNDISIYLQKPTLKATRFQWVPKSLDRHRLHRCD
jgi:hypothetical protein